MNIVADNHQITLINEPVFSKNSTDNKRSYEKIFCRSKESHYSAHGIIAGDAVFALKIPTLELTWCDKVDQQTCFGVYWIEVEDCLITWGEVAISRYTSDSEKVWSASGADIFEGFECKGNHIMVTDIGER